MPIIQSAIKAARQAELRRERRRPVKSLMKSSIRKVTNLVKEGRENDAAKALPGAFKAIDMAAKRHIIHWKNAARKKSLISRLVAAKGK